MSPVTMLDAPDRLRGRAAGDSCVEVGSPPGGVVPAFGSIETCVPSIHGAPPGPKALGVTLGAPGGAMAAWSSRG